MKCKAHAVRPRMRFTCRCGWQGDLKADEALAVMATEMRRLGVGRRKKRSRNLWKRVLDQLFGWFHHPAGANRNVNCYRGLSPSPAASERAEGLIERCDTIPR
jgi:hypothetical protein